MRARAILSLRGEKSQAVIYNEHFENAGKAGYQYHVSTYFHTNEGKEIDAEYIVTEGFYNKAFVGKKVDIKYDPRHPEDSLPTYGSTIPPNMWNVVALLALFVMVLLTNLYKYIRDVNVPRRRGLEDVVSQ